ncbi:MAG: hypothetical protein QOJ63_1677 [Solirubrobacteraceae bacterium]|jgi:hypothetical protein|nr:hypothetical protein [Solirubrobacteraceae bacterium]
MIEPTDLPNARSGEQAQPTDLPHVESGTEVKSATQLGLLLDAASALVDEQFKIGDRLDAKSRNQIVIAATFFAGVQAGVISLVGGILGPSASTVTSPYVPYLAITACVAVVALVSAVVLSAQGWRLRPEKSLGVATIRDYIPFAREGRSGVGANLVWAYTKVVEARQEQNADRAAALARAGWACLVTLVVAGLELVLAFVAVIAR